MEFTEPDVCSISPIISLLVETRTADLPNSGQNINPELSAFSLILYYFSRDFSPTVFNTYMREIRTLKFSLLLQ